MVVAALCWHDDVTCGCSIRHFVENCGDYVVNMVDSLLNLLTDFDHSKVVHAEQVRAACSSCRRLLLISIMKCASRVLASLAFFAYIFHLLVYQCQLMQCL